MSVHELFPALPEDAPPIMHQRQNAEKAVASKFYPAIIKEGRQLERATIDTEIVPRAVAGALLAAAATHEAELGRRDEMHQRLVRAERASAWRAGGFFMAFIGACLGVMGTWTVTTFATFQQMTIERERARQVLQPAALTVHDAATWERGRNEPGDAPIEAPAP